MKVGWVVLGYFFEFYRNSCVFCDCGLKIGFVECNGGFVMERFFVDNVF